MSLVSAFVALAKDPENEPKRKEWLRVLHAERGSRRFTHAIDEHVRSSGVGAGDPQP